MNPIREFFKKKRVEQKFKQAGQGHRLAEDGSGSSKTNQRTAPHNIPRQYSQGAAQKHQPSEGAQKAGAAAIARFEQKQPGTVNWSLAAIRRQARKEIELETQAAEKIKHAPKEVIQDSAPMLTVSGVYFSCPLIGQEVLTRQEIEAKIKEFLYEQLAEERGLTSCLIIHTCNKNKEKVKLGIETLCKYLTNIIDNPTEEKYHKIRINNKVFQERVALLEGSYDFLMAAGFQRQTLQLDDNEDEFFVFPKEKLADIENLQILKDALLCAEPMYPILDRNLRVLMPTQAASKINLPKDFFNLTSEELLKEQEARADAVEINTQLRTKAMREREAIKELRIYRYSLVRVRLPDGIILQGTFNVREKLSAVKKFVLDNLAEPEREFILLSPGRLKLTEDESSLLELHLVPAVILTLNWKTADDSKTGDEIAYLKPETMALLQDL